MFIYEIKPNTTTLTTVIKRFSVTYTSVKYVFYLIQVAFKIKKYINK